MAQISAWIGLITGVFLTVASVEAAQIDINKADAALMAAEVGGLGIGRAEAIVRYRASHGPFKSVEELGNVPGISKRIIDINRSNLTTGTQENNPSAVQP